MTRKAQKMPKYTEKSYKSCYNSKTFKPILMFYSLFTRYYDWADNYV